MYDTIKICFPQHMRLLFASIFPSTERKRSSLICRFVGAAFFDRCVILPSC